MAGFIHDVSDFVDRHPGGRELLEKSLGTDCTASFFGGVYEHSNAAHNVRTRFSVVFFIIKGLRASLVAPHYEVA